jgi:uncharacterized protein (TIRG00374 family)
MRRTWMKTVVTYLVPLVLVVLTSWYLVNGMSSDDWLYVQRDIFRLDPLFFTAAVLLALLAHVSRALRWCYLLRPTKEVSLRASFNAVMIGYAANAIVPRAGEVARPLVLAQRASISNEAAIGSVVLERVLDIVTLLGGIVVAMLISQGALVDTMLRLRGTAPSTFAAADVESMMMKLVVLLALLSAGVAAIVFTTVGERVISMTFGRVRPAAADSINRAIARLRQGFSVIRQPRLVTPILAHTMLIWILYAATTWGVLLALPYTATAAAGPIDAMIMLVILAVAVTVAPTPGAIGVYHVAGQIALVSLYGATPAEGFVFAMVSWFINQGLALGVGGIAWITESRSGIEIRLFSSTPRENASS